MPLTKEEYRKAITAMCGWGRDIIASEKAEEFCAAFGVTMQEIGLRGIRREAGVNWDERSEVWESGESVGAYEVATMIAQHFDCPQNEYRTNYHGEGKRAEALHVKAILRLREGLLGEPPLTCPGCGSLNIDNWGGDERTCWSCHRDGYTKDGE